jgi:hypothetical protein
VFCKNEEQFLIDWRNFRNKKRKYEEKMKIGINLIQKEKVCDDIVSRVLEYI